MSNTFRRVIPCAILACAALCALPWRGEAAAEYYVTPTGAGDYGGTNWGNAFSNVQDAATPATGSGDKIYLQSGVYSNASQIVISNAAGVTIYGGCNGGGAAGSNTYSGTNSMLTKVAGGTNRIVCGYVSTLTMAGVTVSGGYFANGTNAGAGMYFTNCAVTLTNCAVRDNTNQCSGAATYGYGGGIYCAGGSLAVADCVFSNNTLTDNSHVNSLYGGAIYAANATLNLMSTLFMTNSARQSVSFGNGVVYGGAIYSAGGSVLITNCVFSDNLSMANNQHGGYGGALYLTGGAATIAHCTFSSNTARGYSGGIIARGGALYANNTSSLIVSSNYFGDNCSTNNGGWNLSGAALYISGCATTVLDQCIIEQKNRTYNAEHVYISGGTKTYILNTAVQNNSSGRGIYFAGAAASLFMSNCLVMNNGSDGLVCSAGTAAVFNCLLTLNGGAGLLMSGGTATVSSCTLADNGGWGLNSSGGTGTVFNSIAWGNGAGGFSSNASLGVTYSCSQNAPHGINTSNILRDPLFASLSGYYYLSASGLKGQIADSPCIDAGNGTAAFWGLTNRTTRTDGTNDAETVDMGYHYKSGVDDAQIQTNLLCYVDAVNGNNASNGLSWSTAWKSITYALTNVARGATINVASGTYDAANGEIFPLTVVNADLNLLGTGRVATFIDAGATNRVFYARNKGVIRLEGMTFRNGFLSSAGNGAGLYMPGCSSVTISNCAILNNLISFTSGSSYGAGLYVTEGSLVIADCLITNNRNKATTTVTLFYGGGIYFSGSTFVMRNTTNTANAVTNTGVNGGICLGGALYCSAASAEIVNCLFDRNAANSGNDRTGSGSGAIYLNGGAAEIFNCMFTNNYANTRNNQPVSGGVIGAYGVNPLNLVSNEFRCNYLATGNTVNRGGTIYAQSGTTRMELCNVSDNSAAGLTTARGDIYLGGGMLSMTNCQMINNGGEGLVVSAGTATVFNCLLAANGSDGLRLTNGAVSVVNCTMADNAGWGINRTGGTGAVLNCIAWGNGSGGITSNSNVNVSYSCSQDSPYGSPNQTNDPVFCYTYYLSVSNLPGQTASSPCIDAGSNTPTFWGLTNRTTRTDGSNDIGIVDLGYHYTNGVDSSYLSNAVLYVNAGSGSDENNGLSADAALKTMTNALAKVFRGGTIYVATGTYNAANGEVFPLTVAAPALRIIGTNRSATIFDAGAANRVFYALNKGVIGLEDVTFRNGYLGSADNGAGLYFFGCGSVTLSNCAILNNLISFTSGSSYGAGLYCYQGSLVVADCLITNNRNRATASVTAFYGGGIYFSGSTLAMRNTTNLANAVTNTGLHGGRGYGGALYCSATSAQIANSLFDRNYSGSGNSEGGSGCIYLSGGAVDIANCIFTNNCATAMNSQRVDGGVLGVYGVNPLNLVSNEFRRNFLATANATPRGGTIYASSGLINLRLCNVFGNSNTDATARGDIYLASSVLSMTNCLVAANKTSGLILTGGTATVVNCTFADNSAWGITNAGVLTVKNSIVWDNTLGGIATNVTTAITYTDSQELLVGTGNMIRDPLFAAPVTGDYHEQSSAGSWHAGVWEKDLRMSPCIDAGEPAPGSAYALEPKPNGGRVNMGAYGNTAQASRSSRGTVIAVW